MRVLITGAGGQLGTDLQRILLDQLNVKCYALSRKDLNVTDASGVRDCMNSIRPEVVIHAAANTNVDGCELDPDSAYRVNTYGTRNMAVAAEKCRAKIVYISTDYVFDGKGREPFQEDSRTSPINVYGASKLAGEEMVKCFSTKFFIVRTSWLYGWTGKNFVKTILKLAKEQSELTVVDDQVGSPTFSLDLAQCIIRLMVSDAYGIYHVTNSGQCSWYEFSTKILEKFCIDEVRVTPVKSEEFKRPAPRPAYSVLGNRALRLNGFSRLPSWQDGMRRFADGYSNDYQMGKPR